MGSIKKDNEKMHVADFWKELYADSTSEEERLLKLLDLRGFLIDTYGSKYCLSDNSHLQDEEYLDLLLTQYGLGCVDNNRIHFHNMRNYYLLEGEFEKKEKIKRDVGSYIYGWDYFRHRKCGHKAAVQWLEPFIAKYVKAMSSAGVILIGSCDGNHNGENKAFLQYQDYASPIWHTLIVQELRKQGISLNWRRNSTLYFRPETQYKTYFQLYRAACYVYDHRFELRDIKKRALEGYSNSFLKRVDREVIEKEFSERVQQLFHDTEL